MHWRTVRHGVLLTQSMRPLNSKLLLDILNSSGTKLTFSRHQLNSKHEFFLCLQLHGSIDAPIGPYIMHVIHPNAHNNMGSKSPQPIFTKQIKIMKSLKTWVQDNKLKVSQNQHLICIGILGGLLMHNAIIRWKHKPKHPQNSQELIF